MKLAITCLIVSLFCAPAIALDIKGVELGKQAMRAQLEESLGLNYDERKLSTCRPKAGSVYECDGGTKLEGVPVYTEVTFTADDTIEEIAVGFLPNYFDVLLAAATQKWGKPVIAKVPMQNGFGAQYSNLIAVWTQRDGSSVSLSQYGTDIQHGRLQLKAHGEPKLDPSNSRM